MSDTGLERLRSLQREVESLRRDVRTLLVLAALIAGAHGLDISDIIPGY